MFDKNILIIGGSVAGCATAVLLQRLGAHVTILERSSGRLLDRGVGITLPINLVQQCMELNLFDRTIPHLSIHDRSFSRIASTETGADVFWKQPFNGVMALNWIDVYQNLRRRIGKDFYHSETTVTRVIPKDKKYQIETNTGKIYFADLIIAADGVGSSVRKQLLPHTTEEYAGYIAWRGVIDDNEIHFNNHAAYFVFSYGHLLLYRIPARDYQTTGKTLLNWAMYESTQDQSLAELLTDKFGRQNSRSIPAGNLSEAQLHYLHKLSNTVLPPNIANIICKTPHPFIQAIFDFQVPSYENQAVIFVGDAAATLRPHTGSGVLKALSNAIALYSLVQNMPSDDPMLLAMQWQRLQRPAITEEILKAKIMGHALVTLPPEWPSMTQASTDRWWLQIMQNQHWYATSSEEKDKHTLFKADASKRTASHEKQVPSHHMQSKL